MKKDLQGYKTLLDLRETEIAIKFVKDEFEEELAKSLNLLRVSAPIFVRENSGLNDNLNGFEKPVSFTAVNVSDKLEIVQSLAKWKRYALKKYNFSVNSGLYTDMNAIRPFEELDNIHSLYVDQWDWEKVISKENRNINYLKSVVKKIYKVLLNLEQDVYKKYHMITPVLPKDIYFINSLDLEAMYPNLTPKERENAICKEKKAVFLIGIGDELKNGSPHDGRSPDYDDWSLNGDILLWYEPLEMAFEISSMGIRVDRDAMLYQLEKRNALDRLALPYHKALIDGELPLTIGGGIGQSRLCMFFLKKVHIGEVQVSEWSKEEIKRMKDAGVELL